MEVKRKVLEIGYGGLPIGRDTEYGIRDMPTYVEYHGIDAPKKTNIETFRATLFGYNYDPVQERIDMLLEAERIRRDLKSPNVALYRMDARALGFRSGVFDEVHMHYFISDPNLEKSELETAMIEAKRVLKKSGALIATGEVSLSLEHSFVDTPGNVLARDLLENAGFKVQEGLEALRKATVFSDTIEKLTEIRTDPVVVELRNMGTILADWASDSQFIAIARK